MLNWLDKTALAEKVSGVQAVLTSLRVSSGSVLRNALERRLRYMLSDIDVRSMSDQQPSDEKLQALTLIVLPLNKLDAGAAFPRVAHDGRVNNYRRKFAGDLQYQSHDFSAGETGISRKAASTHRNVEQRSVAGKSLAAESDRKFSFHTLVLAAILTDTAVANTPS